MSNKKVSKLIIHAEKRITQVTVKNKEEMGESIKDWLRSLPDYDPSWENETEK